MKLPAPDSPWGREDFAVLLDEEWREQGRLCEQWLRETLEEEKSLHFEPTMVALVAHPFAKEGPNLETVLAKVHGNSDDWTKVLHDAGAEFAAQGKAAVAIYFMAQVSVDEAKTGLHHGDAIVLAAGTYDGRMSSHLFPLSLGDQEQLVMGESDPALARGTRPWVETMCDAFFEGLKEGGYEGGFRV